ncbi:MAG: alpha/beta fold hydrolase [Candidatus Dormibacteria bacterium]
MTQLHVDDFGQGVPAVFVHGSFGWGLDTFPDQRALSDSYRVMLIDRRGFGRSSPIAAGGWPVDSEDLADLLADLGSAHLVGQSYGAVVALVMASRYPERVRSLVVIEPPAFGLAQDDPYVKATTQLLGPVFERASTMSAREFLEAWAAATGMTEERYANWSGAFGEMDWSAVEASRLEAWPGDAPIDLDALRNATFPKVVVRGAWKPADGEVSNRGKDFAAICCVLAEQIGARLVVFEGSSHNPQLQEPVAFNELLLDAWSG